MWKWTQEVNDTKPRVGGWALAAHLWQGLRARDAGAMGEGAGVWNVVCWILGPGDFQVWEETLLVAMDGEEERRAGEEGGEEQRVWWRNAQRLGWSINFRSKYVRACMYAQISINRGVIIK